jgi:arabinose-5-phosphate isomerase
MDVLQSQILQEAARVLRTEAQGIMDLIHHLDDNFTRMVRLICDTPGRVIIGGIGKSGIIGRKIVATLNSTGTRAVFLHPVEAMHGDLGMVGSDDIFIALSTSGETEELNALLPSIRQMGCKIVAFTGNPESTLGCNSDITINVGVVREACSLGLAPTASSTALLAMGDALAVVLTGQKRFQTEDFKRIHPAGALGQRLAARVDDIMITGTAVPSVVAGSLMSEAIAEVDRKGLGAALVTRTHVLAGIITDGDIRRLVAARRPIDDLLVDEVMSPSPKRSVSGTPVFDALNLMEKHQITVLPITDKDGIIIGILHLHDILGKGEFKFNGNISK